MRLTNRRFSLVLSGIALLTFAACSGAQENPDVGRWPFQYSDEGFKSGAMLDLRYLNEKEAGESGFVHLSADGNSFVLGNGKPVRFWAVGSDVYRQTPADMARHARFLAKLGVNMIRLHTQIAPTGPNSSITDVNQKEIDGIWRCVAAMKKEGIYTTISPYWANGKDAAQWGIEGYARTGDLWGLLFFNPKLQAGYKAWVRALYAPNNPYTGIPLAKDPSVGIIQVQNEDSLLFWTTQGMKPEQQEKLGMLFGQWLDHKYGSLAKASQAWEGVGNPKDDFANGKVGLNLVYAMTIPQTGGTAKRVSDELEFYAETQHKFYADIAAYYHQTLGCRQLINASNWITADPIKLNDAERWTYTAADVVAVNRYFNGGTHVGDNNGWRIDPGHFFTDESALTHPRDLPTNLKQVAGHPTIITESSWVSPLGFQSEGPFLMAAYQSLTGVDTFYWFSATVPEYEPNPFLGFLNLNGQHPLFKWSTSIPSIMSSFPAAALMYREGYIKQGEPVVHEERSLQSIWNRETPIIAEDRSFDPNRNTGNTVEHSNITHGVDPLAFLVGPVDVKYGGNPEQDHVVDLSKYIDNSSKTVTSITGEVKLNYGTGICTINAPRAQGACGFLKKAGDIRLSDIAIRSGDDYAAVYAVSMDGQPLSASHKILLQVGTSARPDGWQVKEADFQGDDKKQTFHGYQIVKTGNPPWMIADTDVTIVLKNAGITKATALDTAGYPAAPVPITHPAAGATAIKLPHDAIYVILE